MVVECAGLCWLETKVSRHITLNLIDPSYHLSLGKENSPELYCNFFSPCFNKQEYMLKLTIGEGVGCVQRCSLIPGIVINGSGAEDFSAHWYALGSPFSIGSHWFSVA